METRFSEAEIIGFLKESSAGLPVKELYRKHEFCDASFSIWMGALRSSPVFLPIPDPV